jgi:hypothetical protein
MSVRHAFGLPDEAGGPTVDNEWNLPITAVEAARINFVENVVQERKSRDLAPVVRADPDYAGLQIDWEHDKVVVQIKGGASPALESSIMAMDLGWPIKVEIVRYSAAELNALQDEIDSTYGQQGQRIKTSHDEPANNVEVVTWSQGVADEIDARYGGMVNAHVGGAIKNYDGTAANCPDRWHCDPPIRGGALLKREHDSAPCSTGFVVSNTFMLTDMSNHGEMVTTAGHCWSYSQEMWRTGNGNVGRIFDFYGETGGAITDADVAFINILDSEKCNDVIDHAQPGNDYAIDITSAGCAVERDSGCGDSVGDTRWVSTGNSDIKFTTTLSAVNVTVYANPLPGAGSGYITKKHSRELNGDPFTGGDSGSPVFRYNTAHGVFFGGNGSRSYYSQIKYVIDLCGTNCKLKTKN